MKYTLLLLFVLGALNASGQSKLDRILSDIEKNNTSLAYLKDKIKAEQLGYKTGLNPANPEIGLNYLWGSPDNMGNRTDFSISQSFDFPTVYSVRRHISEARVEQAVLQLEDYRMRLQLEARRLCYQLIYINKYQTELNARKMHARQLAEAYERMMDAGETNLIEFNKSVLNSINAEQAATKNATERDDILMQLQALNGGIAISLEDDAYPLTKNFDDFDKWVNTAVLKHPYLSSLKQEVDILKQEEKLTHAMRLPKLNAGYMSEKTSDEHFQGLTLGLSVPLWENKHRQPMAKAQSVAGIKMAEDENLKFYHHIKNVFDTTGKLKSIARQMSSGLEKYNNADLLQKAYDSGELSLITYLMELKFHYEMIDRALEAERDYRHAKAELEIYSD